MLISLIIERKIKSKILIYILDSSVLRSSGFSEAEKVADGSDHIADRCDLLRRTDVKQSFYNIGKFDLMLLTFL